MVTPNDFYRAGGRWFVPVIIVIAVVAAIGIGGWRLHWWLQQQDVNHQNQIYQNSYGTQSADIQDMENAINAIPSAMNGAQAAADARQACEDSARITLMPLSDKPWVMQNCSGSALSPTSSYNK